MRTHPTATEQTYIASARAARARPLSLDECDHLARLAQAGDRAAGRRAVESVMGVLPRIVRGAAGSRIISPHRHEELLQTAAQYVCESIDRWDPAKGTWRTYALSCARYGVFDELSEGVTTVPVHLTPELRRAARDVLAEKVTFDEATRRAGVSEAVLPAAIQAMSASYLSADYEAAGDERVTPLVVADPDSDRDYEDVIDEDATERLLLLVERAGFTEDEKYLLFSLRGLFGYPKMSGLDLAAEIGLSRANVYSRAERLEQRLKLAVSMACLFTPGEPSSSAPKVIDKVAA